MCLARLRRNLFIVSPKSKVVFFADCFKRKFLGMTIRRHLLGFSFLGFGIGLLFPYKTGDEERFLETLEGFYEQQHSKVIRLKGGD